MSIAKGMKIQIDTSLQLESVDEQKEYGTVPSEFKELALVTVAPPCQCSTSFLTRSFALAARCAQELRRVHEGEQVPPEHDQSDVASEAMPRPFCICSVSPRARGPPTKRQRSLR
jgi:hypothetical protein